MEMKIVGAASDEEMAEEIEDIARVFVYEQHLKEFTELLRPRRRLERKRIQITENPPPLLPRFQRGYVKGFC